MGNVILFFGSFDPLHKGHISIINEASKTVKADLVYLGLNKSSKKGRLTSFYLRKRMLNSYIKDKPLYKITNFSFDYQNLDITYKNIFNLVNEDDHNYILIGQDQLAHLTKWYNYELLVKKFTFIIAKRKEMQISEEDLNNPHYIFIDHQFKNISSTLIKEGNYQYTDQAIKEFIIQNNIYLKQQIKPYLDLKRYKHCLSVAKTALLINKKGNLGLDNKKVEKAALLHDIAKNLEYNQSLKLMQEYYPEYLNEDFKIWHQYLGEHVASRQFYVEDREVLNAIKYHTTGRIKMSKLEKLVYVADKIEPTRRYDTSELINDCINDFELGFIKVLTNSKLHLEQKGIEVTNRDTRECFKYYLK